MASVKDDFEARFAPVLMLEMGKDGESLTARFEVGPPSQLAPEVTAAFLALGIDTLLTVAASIERKSGYPMLSEIDKKVKQWHTDPRKQIIVTTFQGKSDEFSS